MYVFISTTISSLLSFIVPSLCTAAAMILVAAAGIVTLVVSPDLFCTLLNLFHYYTVKHLVQLLQIVSSVPSNNKSSRIEEVAAATDECSRAGESLMISGEDVEVVMEKLRITRRSSEEGDDDDGGGAMEGVCQLLEEKEVSLRELETAFGVFDENGDGDISAEELRRVMRRLGLEEGMRLEDCKRMIRAYDEDGDGKISFHEFKEMLECAT